MGNFRKQFGGKINSDLIKQYERSDNWENGKFQNLMETKLSIGLNLEDKIVLTVAALEERKGIHFVMKAVSLLKEKNPKIKYLIVGEGSFGNSACF